MPKCGNASPRVGPPLVEYSVGVVVNLVTRSASSDPRDGEAVEAMWGMKPADSAEAVGGMKLAAAAAGAAAAKSVNLPRSDVPGSDALAGSGKYGKSGSPTSAFWPSGQGSLLARESL